ncbi:PIR Superfamily Protein [Plasmodium ovale wallikeri]|uniref:PIR Superfamily Protein n=1 Tax=Plasmodium ovale wallikeri TaxID=864142 RepID=A0A1A9AK62_PLAOA|nr:PIR Superfamily Protein [Plasmodium ovale wallikeri]SBT57005.1 PIR Superfamily Protein [Plasmodium ovale wallikeri]
MEQNIKVSDLPSVKFNEELKRSIDYDTFQGYSKIKTTHETIDKWINDFKSKIEEYLLKSSHEFSTNDKRCKDFNYFIKNILNKIDSLSDNMLKRSMWSKNIKEFTYKHFSSIPVLTCKENNIYSPSKVKNFFDFCEDNDYIQAHIDEVKKSEECQRIINHMSSLKNKLIGIKNIIQRKSSTFQMTNTCTPSIIDSVYPTFECISYAKQGLELDDNESHSNHSDDHTLGGISTDESITPSGEVTHGRQVSSSHSEGNSSNYAIGLVSLPAIGISVFAFLLYKYTPFRPMLHSYFKNKLNTTINHDDGETNQMLSNTSNYEDIYSENIHYNLSYETLQN